MKVAVEGCCHGQLDAIYTSIASLEERNGYKVSLLLICGDFQAVRNESDLACMSVPDKYKEMGEFWKYYTGEKVAPILTIIIGGNHEASNYFWELFHGGWIAPNMYFLGHAGCVQVNGIRIAGASGIFGDRDFQQGFWERVPYTPGSMRSIYHIREYNIMRLSLLTPAPTVFLSHDWPQNIAHHGDKPRLLRAKPFFGADIDSGKLGSPPMWGLLNNLRPGWWFSAHLHVRFQAQVVWEEGGESEPAVQGSTAKAPIGNPDEIAIEDDDFDDVGPPVSSDAPPMPTGVNPDEIKLDDLDAGEEDEKEVAASLIPGPSEGTSAPREWGDGKGWPNTKFLALDKCLPRRQFLEIVDIPEPSHSAPSSGPPVLTYDPEWLAITRAFNPFMSTSKYQLRYPEEAEAREAVATELKWVEENVLDGIRREKRIDECQVFAATAPGPQNPGRKGGGAKQPTQHTPSPQTAAFCTMLGIENKVDR
ncbi:DBR1-domain-containing protein [Trametopsis cervina]|nr:DBR1-domain-containing protein [Trametopsis cervina]